MIPVRFVIAVKTPNTLNGSMGTTRGARMAADGLRRKQRQLGYEHAIESLRAVGVPTRERWMPARVRKGVVVRPGFSRTVANVHAHWSVELVRLSSGQLDEHDGLRAALKSVVDGIADALDVNDGDRARVTWLPRQRKAPRGVVGVEVQISQSNPQHQEHTR